MSLGGQPSVRDGLPCLCRLFPGATPVGIVNLYPLEFCLPFCWPQCPEPLHSSKSCLFSCSIFPGKIFPPLRRENSRVSWHSLLDHLSLSEGGNHLSLMSSCSVSTEWNPTVSGSCGILTSEDLLYISFYSCMVSTA